MKTIQIEIEDLKGDKLHVANTIIEGMVKQLKVSGIKVTSYTKLGEKNG